ncbi:hypothetical protein JCM10207_001508 [Rhodosporidiobolus poonsookiae]
MASEAPAAFPLPPLAGPPQHGAFPPTSQALPGFGELDSGFYASTSSAPYASHLSYPPISTPPLNSYPPPPTPLSHSAPTYSLPPATPTHPHNGPSSPGVPDIGRIRCYWTILSPSLDFVFLDPILEHHTGEWSNKLIGTNLLDWVHPDDRAQLTEDLLPREDEVAGVESAGVFGSVTRCRYSRLVRVLRDLGCPQPPSPPDAKIYAIDEQYLNLDLTTSWIAGDRKGKGKGKPLQGAVLAFFHASTDKDAVGDNDSRRRTDWSNWCGPSIDTPGYLTPPQCDELMAVLERLAASSDFSATSPTSGAGGGDAPPAHVFQILDRNGHVIVTFPRPRGQAGKTGADEGRYDVEQFSALAREVMARPREAVASRTSCTKRYRSKHPVMKDGTLTTIESVVIMYGAITFACFQTGGVYLSSARKAGLSLITNGDALGGASEFSLEEVPTTPTVGGFNGHASANGSGNKRLSLVVDPPQPQLVPPKSESMSPPSKRFKAAAASLPAAMPLGPGDQGLSIMTSGRLFRNTLDVESITAGGISPTVASASAILGSFSADAHLHAQQQHHAPHFPHGPGPAHGHAPAPSPSNQQSYAAFYASQPAPPAAQPPFSSPFDPAQLHHPQQYSQPHPTPPAYAYSPHPHPLSQSHSSYFSPAPSHSPHPSDPSAHGVYPPSTPSEAPGGYPQGGMNGLNEYGQPVPLHTPGSEHPPPPPPVSAPAASNAVVIADPATIPVPPPPPPGSQSGKRPPKQRPDGPVYKPNQKACESCGTVNSPEWRKGPTGAKSLCNACGLRYARSVARQKKQAEAAANGGVAPKKTKKKGKAAASAQPEAPSSPATPLPPPGSQPSPLPSSMAGSFDFSPYARASPKPYYTPYHTTAPTAPGSYAPMASPSTTHAPFHSPLPVSTPGGTYFPSFPPPNYSMPPPFSAAGAPLHMPAPIATHTPLPPPISIPTPTSGAPPPLPSPFDYPHSRPASYAPTPAHSHPHTPHLVSPHLEQHAHMHAGMHPPQASPLDGPGSAGMFPSRSAGTGGANSGHFQPYDWRHEQAEQGPAGQDGQNGQ